MTEIAGIERDEASEDPRIDGEPTFEDLEGAMAGLDSLRSLDSQWRAAGTKEEKSSAVSEMGRVLASMLHRATPAFDLVMLTIARTELVRTREGISGMSERAVIDVLEKILIDRRPNRMEAILQDAGIGADVIADVAARVRKSTEPRDLELLGTPEMPAADVMDEDDGATTPADVDRLLEDVTGMDDEYRRAVAIGSPDDAMEALAILLDRCRTALDEAEPEEDRRLLDGLRETLTEIREIPMVEGDTNARKTITRGMSDRLYQELLKALITKCHASLMERVMELITNRF